MKATLLVYPNGRSVLAFPDSISRTQIEAVQRAWTDWIEGNADHLAIIPECEVVQVRDITLELGPDAQVDLGVIAP